MSYLYSYYYIIVFTSIVSGGPPIPRVSFFPKGFRFFLFPVCLLLYSNNHHFLSYYHFLIFVSIYCIFVSNWYFWKSYSSIHILLYSYLFFIIYYILFYLLFLSFLYSSILFYSYLFYLLFIFYYLFYSYPAGQSLFACSCSL